MFEGNSVANPIFFNILKPIFVLRKFLQNFEVTYVSMSANTKPKP